MERLGKWWKSVPKPVRQSLVLVLGTFIVLGGVILLPLPGPGWVIIFFGFAILATEFSFAERVRDGLIDALKSIVFALRKWWKSVQKRF